MGQATNAAVAALVAAQTDIAARLESLTAQVAELKTDTNDQTNADAINAAIQGIGGAVDKLATTVNPPAPEPAEPPPSPEPG